MRASLLKAYHRLPPFARDLVASLRGHQLRRWRYGLETPGLVTAARAREAWTDEQWKTWQNEHLAALLERAVTRVPYYRALWHQQGTIDSRKSRIAPWRELVNWPVLKKPELRHQPEAFVADDCDPRRMECDHTSGTTGTPLRLWHKRETARSWYALMEARWRGWYGLSRSDRWAILGGQLVVPIQQKSPPFWVWNGGLKQLYLSSYHLSAQTCAAYLEAMQESRVVYVWGYASSLYSLALFADEQRLRPPLLQLVISNAEPLYAHQRELIQEVFRCPVRDTYGMSEMVGAASECDAGRLHLWPEVAIYEVLRDDSDDSVQPGEIGRLVCTGLLNPDMPLIRYEVGDRVALAPPGEYCPCGRTLPLLRAVEGRSDDVILTRDGRRVGRLDPVFKSDLPIREGQIIQESLDLVRVLLVPAPGFAAAHEQALLAALRERIGDLPVSVERVAEIPRSANGKFRAVVSRIKTASSA